MRGNQDAGIAMSAAGAWWAPIRRAALATLLLCLCACASVAERSLYEELGGEAGVARLVDQLLIEYKADPRIAFFFAETDEEYLKARLREQICQISGGPCEYTGLSMADAHSGLEIKESEFNWFVEDSERAMRKLGLPEHTQNRLLSLLAPMREEIIRQ